MAISLIRRVFGSSNSGEIDPSKILAPTQQRFLSGSGTYYTPANCRYIKVRMVGGGAGGGAYGSGGAGGGAGGATTFGTILTANGGTCNFPVSIGGTVSVNATSGLSIILALQGGSAGGGGYAGSAQAGVGAMGGSSPFGGAGGGANAYNGGWLNGGNAIANTGSGGGGGNQSGVGSYSGNGGGAGGYIEAVITSPLSSYVYTIGTGGSGYAGPNNSGGAGGSGIIIVEEFYI